MRVLVVTDKYPAPGFPDWNTWMLDHLAAISQCAAVDVVALVYLVPRLRNVVRVQSMWRRLRSIRRLPRTQVQRNGIRVHYLRILNFPSTLSWKLLPLFISAQCRLRFPRNLRGENYDLCLIHGTYPVGQFGLNLSKRLGIPAIIVNHEGVEIYGEYFRPVARKTVVKTLEQADVIIALSNAHVKELEKILPRSRIVTIPHIVQVRERYVQASDDEIFRIVTACRLDAPEKDVDTLLRAFSIVRTYCRSKLTIAGDGYQYGRFVRKSQDLGLSADVRFAGWLSMTELQREIMDHNAFVLPSHYETFGLAIGNTLALGIPAVSLKRVGFLEDETLEEIGCLVAEPPNAEGLAAALISLQTDPMLRRTLGKNGQAFVARQFSVEKHISNYCEVFGSVVDERFGR